MFVIGAIILFREARSADADEGEQEDEFAAKADSAAHGLKVVVDLASWCSSPPSGATCRSC